MMLLAILLGTAVPNQTQPAPSLEVASGLVNYDNCQELIDSVYPHGAIPCRATRFRAITCSPADAVGAVRCSLQWRCPKAKAYKPLDSEDGARDGWCVRTTGFRVNAEEGAWELTEPYGSEAR